MKIGRILVSLLFIAALVPGVAASEGYKVGDEMAPIALEDQHGEAANIDASTRLLLFTRDMDAGDTVKAAMAERSGEELQALGLVYAADISAMPGLVRRMFAVPAMRKRGYAMMLDAKGEMTQRIPSKAGHATLLELRELRIEAIRYLATGDDVTGLFVAGSND